MATAVRRQRSSYVRGLLSSRHIEILEDIGFEWYPPDRLWEKMFSDLKYFYDEYGHCNISSVLSKNFALIYWVSLQRANYKKGKLRKDYQKRLDEIGFQWKIIG